MVSLNKNRTRIEQFISIVVIRDDLDYSVFWDQAKNLKQGLKSINNYIIELPIHI